MRMKLEGWGTLHYLDIYALFFAHVFVKQNETKKQNKAPQFCVLLLLFLIFIIYFPSMEVDIV